MKTINTKIETIAHYRTAYAVILNYFKGELEKLTEGQKADLDGVDDFEDFGYTVINAETIILDDLGDVIAIESLQDFLQHTLQFLQDCADGRKEGADS